MTDERLLLLLLRLLLRWAEKEISETQKRFLLRRTDHVVVVGRVNSS